MPRYTSPVRRVGLSCSLIATMLAAPALVVGQEPDSGLIRVARDEIRAIMAAEAASGYNLQVVTNAGRLSTAVLLQLARAAVGAPADGRRLLLHHEDWYGAYQDVTGLPDDSIPEFISLQLEYEQDQIIDFAPERVRYEVKKGRTPDFVIHVTARWPDGDGVPDKYVFVDTLPDPDMRVINERIITYHLLDFGDMIVQDQIDGIGGRPIQGALGTVFKVIGDGSAVQSRFAISDDGLMVTYATAKKGFIKVRPVSTTLPDGTVIKDTPENRPDLEAIVGRLKEKLEIKYFE